MTKFGLEIKLKAVQQSITIRIENKIITTRETGGLLFG